MKLRIPFVIALLLSPWALAQTTRPSAATQPTWLTLSAGEVRYTPPEDWNALPLTSATDLSAAYKNEDGDVVITLQATPQQQPVPNAPNVAQALGRQILKAIKTDLEKSQTEVLLEPRLERDPRFLVRIRDRIRLDGITTDRLHLYRTMGYNLVQTTITVDNQTPDGVKAAFATGEQLLAGALIGKREGKAPATRPVPHKRP